MSVARTLSWYVCCISKSNVIRVVITPDTAEGEREGGREGGREERREGGSE